MSDKRYFFAVMALVVLAVILVVASAMTSTVGFGLTLPVVFR